MKITISSHIIIGLLLFSASCFSNNIEVDTITVHASLFTEGPYGDFWEFEITELVDEGASVNFSVSDRSGAKFTGKTRLKKTELNSIKSTLMEQEFWKLPKFMSAKFIALHSPDYRLEVCIKSECTKVNLYDPISALKENRKGNEIERFTMIWNTVLSYIPSWPSGQPTLTAIN